MNNLTIFIRPTYLSTVESMGFDLETESVNENAVLHEQGYNTEEVEVECREKFDIPVDFEGIIDCSNTNYKITILNMSNINERAEFKDSMTFEAGKYIFNSDGLTIQQLKGMTRIYKSLLFF